MSVQSIRPTRSAQWQALIIKDDPNLFEAVVPAREALWKVHDADALLTATDAEGQFANQGLEMCSRLFVLRAQPGDYRPLDAKDGQAQAVEAAARRREAVAASDEKRPVPEGYRFRIFVELGTESDGGSSAEDGHAEAATRRDLRHLYEENLVVTLAMLDGPADALLAWPFTKSFWITIGVPLDANVIAFGTGSSSSKENLIFTHCCVTYWYVQKIRPTAKVSRVPTAFGSMATSSIRQWLPLPTTRRTFESRCRCCHSPGCSAPTPTRWPR
eukprot:SAG22_NODE_45_length_24718_cov_12.462448_16_plen_272_part_00